MLARARAAIESQRLSAIGGGHILQSLLDFVGRTLLSAVATFPKLRSTHLLNITSLAINSTQNFQRPSVYTWKAVLPCAM